MLGHPTNIFLDGWVKATPPVAENYVDRCPKFRFKTVIEHTFI